MDDFDKTIPPQQEHITTETDDVTIPGKRDRGPERRFEIGDLIMNRYKILAELGQGGMGVVYKCFDETAGVEIALKALPPELSHNTVEMEDIRDNFQLVSKLVHQNIAISKNLERDNSNGNYYLIMECCEGEDLRRWIKRKQQEGELTENDILPIIKQIADALDYAHKQKIIHRDIKPGNIMINSAGDIKVLDFGLAAQIYTSMTRVSMAYHGTSGTGPYMAPEQWRGKKQGAASDQYALAVMTYEMLSGVLPFESTDAAVLREAVLHEAPDPIPNISRTAQNAIKRAMSKESSERFESCSDFANALGGKRFHTGMKHRKSAVKWFLSAIVVIAGIVLSLFSDHLSAHKQALIQEPDNTKKQQTDVSSDHPTWSSGREHPENNDLVADRQKDEQQNIKPGYVRTDDGRMQWTPGMKHPKNNDLVADQRKDIWQCTKPGYVWDNDCGIQWCPNMRHPKNEDLVTDTIEGNWKSIKPGYEWDGNSGVRWCSGIISNDGTRKTSATEGKWLFKRGCPLCDGNGEITKLRGCTYCDGTGKRNSERECHSCNGKKQWDELENCKSCDGSGTKDVQSVCSSCQGNPVRKCNNPKARYINFGYGTQFHIVPCDCNGYGCISCMYNGSSICDSCNGSGTFRCTNYACKGGKEYKKVSCPDCSQGQRRVTRTCRTCYGDGKVSHKIDCKSCGGRGQQRQREYCNKCQGKKYVWE